MNPTKAMADQPPNASVKFDSGVNVSKPAKRIRWATQRVSSVKARAKRSGIISRLQRSASSEKKRESGGSDSTASNKGGQNGVEESDESEDNGRIVYFNQPLPDHMKDEKGNPLVHYERNKVRTAKYTPLSFFPKNLYWQFHQVANIYFLMLIILGVSTPHFYIVYAYRC